MFFDEVFNKVCIRFYSVVFEGFGAAKRRDTGGENFIIRKMLRDFGKTEGTATEAVDKN